MVDILAAVQSSGLYLLPLLNSLGKSARSSKGESRSLEPPKRKTSRSRSKALADLQIRQELMAKCLPNWPMSFVDFDTSSSIWSRLTRSFATTYTYSFGGGVIRDVLARCVYGEAAGSVGNLSPSIVLPAILATAFYNYLLLHRSSALFQLGLGLPVLACLFHYGDAFARCTIGTW